MCEAKWCCRAEVDRTEWKHEENGDTKNAVMKQAVDKMKKNYRQIQEQL